MAGRGVQIAEINEDGQATKKTRGLYGRLNTHANGRRSGDQFNVYVCDRLVVPDLTRDELELLRNDEIKLDELTKQFVRQNLDYRYTPTRSGKEATAIENAVKGGALSAGRPLLNPARS